MNLKKTFEKLGLSHKIVSISILIVMIGITTVSAISFYFFRSTLQEIVTNQLESIGDTTANRVEEYGDKSLRFIDRLAHDRLIEGLFLSFESSFYGRGLNPGADEEIFSKDYKSIYSVYSKRLDSMLQDFGFEEIHLSTLDRQIVLSVSVDGNSKMLGKNLENGILKDSKVAKCINSAFSDESDSPHYSGYEYNPIFDEVTAYLCQKAFAEFNHLSEGINIGDTMGVVVAKLKLNHINSIVNRRIGMGETGQAYLIGPDKILRSDFYVHKDEFNVYKSFKENIPVDSETIRNVFKVDSFSQIVKDPAGEKVVSYFKKINFLGQTWGVIVEKQASEVFNAVTKILLFSFVFTAIIIVLSSFVLFYVIPRMVTPVTDAIKSLKNVSGKVNNNSYALKQSSQILDTSSNKVSQSINETMTGLDEVKATLEMNMNYVTKSMDRSKSSAEAAIRGKTYVEQTSLAMDEIETSNDDFASEIDKVNSQLTDIIQIIGEIGDKANVINDIVFQTKLLSFNASVEAARAGEHGKGFAVVAEEVGNLAVASGNAANEIAKILSNSIQTVENIITNSKSSMQNMIDINRAKIQKGQSATKESLEVLEEVMSNAQEVYNMITEIQTASNEQFKGIDHISIQTSELIELAAEFKDLAKNSSSGSDELSNSSSALTSTVSELEDLINQKEEKSAA